MLKAHVVSVSQKNIYKHKINDIYASHKLIYSLFECNRTAEELAASVPSGFSWVELDPTPFGKKYLVFSQREINQVPDVKIESKEIPSKLFDFENYNFSILVNPVYRKRVEEGNRVKGAKGNLVVMRDPIQVEEWFKRRALACGFEVTQLQVSNYDVHYIPKEQAVRNEKPLNKQNSTPFLTVKISGVLRVLDKEKFIETFKAGMGRGRAFGCGLLQVSPIK